MPEGGATARLFVALELPAPIRALLVAWRDPAVAAAGTRVRPLDPGALHATLCFLGAQSEDAIEPIATACASALAGASPPPAALGPAMWLPRRRPRVLAVGLADTTGALAGVQARVAAALVAGGWYRAERRSYLPHVTVARVRGELRHPAWSRRRSRPPLSSPVRWR